MTDLVEKAINLFHKSIASRADHGEALASQLADAGELLATTLIKEKRILLCGHGQSALQAQHLATSLLNQHSRERPGLPAILLNNSVATLTAIAESYGNNDIFSRQIRALGQDGDVLVIYTTTGNPQNLINAVQAAHERLIRVLCIGGSEGGHLAQLMGNDDLDIQIPVAEEFLVYDMHQLITSILCELIDDQLFGEA